MIASEYLIEGRSEEECIKEFVDLRGRINIFCDNNGWCYSYVRYTPNLSESYVFKDEAPDVFIYACTGIDEVECMQNLLRKLVCEDLYLF